MNSVCLYCGNFCKPKNKFCSSKCSSIHSRRVNLEHIKMDLKCGNIIPHLNMRSIKTAIIELVGHRCSICGLEKWIDKSIPLVLDHIDGRSSNNTLNNLRLVCGNCDMQLPTYKSKNKNSDRTNRKKY